MSGIKLELTKKEFVACLSGLCESERKISSSTCKSSNKSFQECTTLSHITKFSEKLKLKVDRYVKQYGKNSWCPIYCCLTNQFKWEEILQDLKDKYKLTIKPVD